MTRAVSKPMTMAERIVLVHMWRAQDAGKGGATRARAGVHGCIASGGALVVSLFDAVALERRGLVTLRPGSCQAQGRRATVTADGQELARKLAEEHAL